MLVDTGFAARGSEPVTLRERRPECRSVDHRFNLFRATVRGRVQ
jgi:hypothetical protein